MTENKKDSNPKDALGVKKVPLHAVPVKPLFEVGLAMMEGGRKYGTHNYREIGVRMSTYYNAVMRHMMAWWEGEDTDADSGVPHLVKAMASLFVVRDGIIMGNCIDDRPIRYPNGIDLGVLNDVAADLIEKYPDCALPFTNLYRHGETAPKVGDKHGGMLYVKAGEDIKVHDHSQPVPNKLTAETLRKSEAGEDLHTIPLDELVKELELDDVDGSEPQFKAGDKVRIKLREDAINSGLDMICKESKNVGRYVGMLNYDTKKHWVKMFDDKEWGFYTDELTLMEDN